LVSEPGMLQPPLPPSSVGEVQHLVPSIHQRHPNQNKVACCCVCGTLAVIGVGAICCWACSG
jgi:hypothetical protein